MNIVGAHAILYSEDADADRAFLRDVLGLGHVDVGGGWLIFGLPPSEVAVHPAESGSKHELYLMCDDIQTFVASMSERGIVCTEPSDQRWGILTTLTLPGGGELGVYEPLHARPEVSPKAPAKKAKAPAKKAKAPAKKTKAPAKKTKAPAKKKQTGKAAKRPRR